VALAAALDLRCAQISLRRKVNAFPGIRSRKGRVFVAPAAALDLRCAQISLRRKFFRSCVLKKGSCGCGPLRLTCAVRRSACAASFFGPASRKRDLVAAARCA
jgi:hypothetical protein